MKSDSRTLVTVVMPAFNAARTVGSAVRTVLGQSHGALELLVCDDGSDDGTAAVVSSFQDPRLELVRSGANQGAAAARDMMISRAAGDWIAVIDADDAWHPERLARLLAAAGDARDLIVFDDIMECTDSRSGMRPSRRVRGPREFAARGVAQDVDPARWLRSERLLIKPLIPRSLIGRTGARHPRVSYGEDTGFFLELVAAGARLRYLPQALYYYRLTAGSSSARSDRHHLMRDMLASALRSIPASKTELRAALRSRIGREEFLIEYAEFLGTLKRGAFPSTVGKAFLDPRLVRELLTRISHAAPTFAGLWARRSWKPIP